MNLHLSPYNNNQRYCQQTNYQIITTIHNITINTYVIKRHILTYGREGITLTNNNNNNYKTNYCYNNKVK